MAVVEEAAGLVTATFIKPIKLEFEKVYYPYLLMNKKRYAGLLWEDTKAYKKMDCKGIETVRRDFCGLVKDVVETSLKAILIHKNPDMAVQYVKGQAPIRALPLPLPLPPTPTPNPNPYPYPYPYPYPHPYPYPYPPTLTRSRSCS